jgi:hypothetical protein
MFSTITFAQVTTSSMSGRVTDGADALIGASIKATHQPSGTVYGAVTNVDGLFAIHGMRIGGPYHVEITYLGYSDFILDNINIQLGETYSLNAQLTEEAKILGEIVVVGTESGNMRSDRAGAVTTINTATITNLPSVTRTLEDITRITPQANGSAIGGGTYRQNNITIDGASFNNKFGIGKSMPANGSPISLDAIEQVSVSITPYDVRQSGFLGSSINAVTRSGDNEFRGSAYTYMNNENYKGNKVEDATFDRSESSYNLYGFRLGGPIVKNKLFFFVNFETEKSVVPGPTRVASTPAHPYTDGKDNVARPTAADLDAISAYLKGTYGYETGPYQGYSYESPGMKILARIDWNINQNHRLNVRYNTTKKKDPYSASTSISGISPAPYSSSNNRTLMHAQMFQNSGYFQEQNVSSVVAELNSSIGNSSNIFRVTYTDQDEPRSTTGKLFPFVDILKDGLPYTSFGTELFSYGNLRKVQTVTVSDDISWTWNIHNLTAGFQYEHDITKNGFQRFGTGYYSFNYVAGSNGVIDLAQTLAAPATTFALTHPNNTALTQEFPTFKFNQFTLFFQDEVNITEKIKMLAGLRLDMPSYPELNTTNANVAALTFGYRKFDTGRLPNATPLFSPRLGLNYDILGNRALVLRGGLGIFTGTIPFVWIVAQAGDAGVLQTTYTKGTIPAFTTDTKSMINEIYGGSFNPSDPAIPSSISVMDRNLKLPQNFKSSLALDAKLPGGILGSVEGIYSRDINSVVVENANLQMRGFTIDGYADQRTILSSVGGAISNGPYTWQSKPSVMLLKNGGETSYWSVTAKLEKTFDCGLSFMGAYTHSYGKSSRDAIGDQLGSAWYNDPVISGSNDYTVGYSGYIIPDRIIASASYRKEYAKHFASTFSVFYNGASQGRFSYIYSNNFTNDGGGSALMYIPKDNSEITFADYTYKDASGATVNYSAADQSKDFWNYVNQDDYLSKHKGEYALRNGALYPWVNTFDFKFMQDFFVTVGGKRNTIQVGIDIMNVGNLINSKWGIQRYYNKNNFLTVANLGDVVAAEGSVKPTFNFLKNGTETLSDTFRANISYTSTYFMQLSLRYIFN